MIVKCIKVFNNYLGLDKIWIWFIVFKRIVFEVFFSVFFLIENESMDMYIGVEVGGKVRISSIIWSRLL